MEEFSKDFLVSEKYSTPKYLNIPILNKFDLEKVKMRVQNLEPNDVMCLKTFIDERYIKTPIMKIKEKIVFLKAIEEGLAKIDNSKKNMTNIMIRDHLKPMLNKALGIVEP